MIKVFGYVFVIVFVFVLDRCKVMVFGVLLKRVFFLVCGLVILNGSFRWFSNFCW